MIGHVRRVPFLRQNVSQSASSLAVQTPSEQCLVGVLFWGTAESNQAHSSLD